MSPLKEQFIEASFVGDHPADNPLSLIGLQDVERIAGEAGISLVQAEIAALKTGVVPAKYVRNMSAMNFDEQIRLLESTAVIIGVGGLGGYVCHILARSGVGKLILVDGDVFEETNLNRQNLCSLSTLGMNKAKAGARSIADINPSVEVIAHQIYLDQDNGQEILHGAHVVLDCLGGLDNRVVLQKAAQDMGIPLVSAALAGFSGHVTTVLPGDKGLFPLMGQGEASSGGGVELDLGCPCPPVSLAASLQCSEAMKVLTGSGPVLQNQLLAFDFLDNSFQVFSLA